ncbi:MAG: iron-containing alcohol dehydrogenase [Firmicutes bacterium]|nr:iron-containing alcohol dehydrogenase [Bacillota bacterium]
MNFEFYTASQIIFGEGTLSRTGPLASKMGKKALIVLGGGSLRKNGIIGRLTEFLNSAGVKSGFYEGIAKEPEVETVDRGVETALGFGADLIIGIGGGSVIDTAKAISGVVTNGGSVRDYLEGVGTGREITKPALPFIAIPTTAGTGAEVTKNAVISSSEEKFKKSIRSPYLIPKAAIVDPQLTWDVPPSVTAACGMDALAQLIEAYISKKSQPFTDALAIYGIPYVARSLGKAVKNGNDAEARADMCLASLLSGCALANSGLGAVHGIAASLGANPGIPHGLACGILLPHIMKINMRFDLRKFAHIGEALTGKRFESEEQAAEAGIEFVSELAKETGIPGDFRQFGIQPELIPQLAEGSKGSSMSGNPAVLSQGEIEGLLGSLI